MCHHSTPPFPPFAGFEGHALTSLSQHLADVHWRPLVFYIELYPEFLRRVDWSFIRVAHLLVSKGYKVLSADQVDDLTSAVEAAAARLGNTPASLEDDRALLKAASDRGCNNYIFVYSAIEFSLPPSPKGCYEAPRPRRASSNHWR